MKKPASFQIVIATRQPITVSGLPSQLWLPAPKSAVTLSRSPICGV